MAKVKQIEGRRSSKAPLTVSRPELLVDGSDREFRRLIHGLLAFTAVTTAVRDTHAALVGLQGAPYTILLCIRHLAAEGPVMVRDVADHLRLSGSFITMETNKLSKLGLLEKTRQGTDRRRVALTLTPGCIALLDSIADLRRQVNDIEFGVLSKDEFRELISLIYRLTESGERALSLLKALTKHHKSLAGHELSVLTGYVAQVRSKAS